MEQLLVKAKELADEAEVFRVSSERTLVHFEANHLKQIQNKQHVSIALRIIKQGRIGFSAATGCVNAQTLLDMALDTSQFGAPANFSFPASAAYPQVEVFDPETDKLTVEKMVELGEHLVARVREHTPDILCEADVTKEVVFFNILNSKGGEASYCKSLSSLNLEGLVVHDTDMLFVGDGESSCHLLVDFNVVADRVIEQLELAGNKATASTGSSSVIFTPRGAASALVAPLVTAFNGKMVLEGASPLRSKLGERVFDKKFSLWDNAILPYHVASRPCDDEGVPSQSILLVGEGVVSNFLYDLQTAALANTRSAGNGIRARGGLPGPGISSLIVGEGDVSLQDMVADMKEGLIVEQLMGAEQGNLLAGDFSGNALLGYRVKGGEIVGRVKDTVVSGNVYEALERIVAVGRESRWVGGVLRLPYLYCSNLSLGTKGG